MAIERFEAVNAGTSIAIPQNRNWQKPAAAPPMTAGSGRQVQMSSVLSRISFDQVQRRTFTPFTITVRHTTAGFGFLTTTAPRGPAQPARTTPSAQTAALASVEFEGHGGANGEQGGGNEQK